MHETANINDAVMVWLGCLLHDGNIHIAIFPCFSGRCRSKKNDPLWLIFFNGINDPLDAHEALVYQRQRKNNDAEGNNGGRPIPLGWGEAGEETIAGTFTES